MKVITVKENSKINVKFIRPSSQAELMESLDKIQREIEEGIFKYKSVIFDSFTVWGDLLLSKCIEETKDAGTFTIKRDLIDSKRSDQATYGAIGQYASDICKAFGRISQLGIIVVCIFQGEENPKWNRDLAVGPSFPGKQFLINAKSYFDLIGLLVTKLDEDGMPVFPPTVKFGPTGQGFMCGYTGKHRKSLEGPCDFSKIIDGTEGGKFILLYSGESKEGKSTSCLATLPQPILDIYVEERNPNSSLDALDS